MSEWDLHDWPTSEIRDVVLEFEDEIKVDFSLAKGIQNVTTDNDFFDLVSFMPEVQVIGLGGFIERRIGKTWGGVLARVLENEDKTRRCYQYLFTFTRQVSVVSLHWWILLPFIIGLWYSLFPIRNLFIAAVLFLPILVVGIMPHVDKMGRKQFHSRTMLIIFYLLILAINANMIPLSVAEPLSISLFIWIAAAATVAWILGWLRALGLGHVMDYIPIFVWTKRGLVCGGTHDSTRYESGWVFDAACWDALHYKAEHKMAKNLQESGRVFEYTWNDQCGIEHSRNCHVRLVVDNPWHSLALGAAQLRIGPLSIETYYKLPFVFFAGMTILALLNVVIGPIPFFESILPEWLWFVIILAFCLIGLYPVELASGNTFWSRTPRFVSVGYLSSSKLRTLWNLRVSSKKIVGEKSDSPSLVVVAKLQNPFKYDMTKGFKDFRDEVSDLSDLQEIQHRWLHDEDLTRWALKIKHELEKWREKAAKSSSDFLDDLRYLKQYYGKTFLPSDRIRDREEISRTWRRDFKSKAFIAHFINTFHVSDLMLERYLVDDLYDTRGYYWEPLTVHLEELLKSNPKIADPEEVQGENLINRLEKQYDNYSLLLERFIRGQWSEADDADTTRTDVVEIFEKILRLSGEDLDSSSQGILSEILRKHGGIDSVPGVMHLVDFMRSHEVLTIMDQEGLSWNKWIGEEPRMKLIKTSILDRLRYTERLLYLADVGVLIAGCEHAPEDRYSL